MRENHLAYRETARKYKLGNSVCQGKNLAIKWERIYLEEGMEGFMKQRSGRPPKNRKFREPLDKSVEEDLIAENQRLRMELEYLKKLSALVLADEQEKNKKQ